ncbi:MAG: MotA/TolQ/ExbB proton channel family protein [Bdellovibrionales bacterium]
MNIFQAFREGGPFMFVILAFGLFTVAFIVERYVSLFLRLKPISNQWITNVREFIVRGEFARAEEVASQAKNPLTPIIVKGLQVLQRGAGEEEVQARMDEELSRSINNIDRRTGFLSMFGNVATLVGLLGTIVGMIHSFAAVAQANPMDRATLLSKGISEAMNCTAFGLIVAVPALVTFAIYQNKTDQIVNDLTQKTSELYHDLIFFFDRGETPSRARTNRPEANA